jgi:hypothetical protein
VIDAAINISISQTVEGVSAPYRGTYTSILASEKHRFRPPATRRYAPRSHTFVLFGFRGVSCLLRDVPGCRRCAKGHDMVAMPMVRFRQEKGEKMGAEQVRVTIGPIGITGPPGGAVLVLVIVLIWITTCWPYVF